MTFGDLGRCGFLHRSSPLRLVVFSVAALLLSSGAAQAQTFLETIVRSSNIPLYVTAPPGDTDRLFIVQQQTGVIEIADLGSKSLLSEPFITIGDLGAGNEQGLLGMAFDPDFATNGFFYINFTASDDTTHIRRYRVVGDPATSNVADVNSAHTILTIEQPSEFHNAGWLGFGPNDGMLYIPTGDGDDDTSAQQLTGTLLGKVLRIDVQGDDFPGDNNRNYAIPSDNPYVGQEGEDEIWAYGLRNPWRASFDRATGDLWIGDVGGASRDEIDFLSAQSVGGENYGWNIREGSIPRPGPTGGPPPPGNVEPVYDYDHDGPDPNFAGSTVVGGYVYRGSVAAFQGHYFFADFFSGNVWKLDPDAVDIRASVTNVLNLLQPDVGGFKGPVSFGEDGEGELYIVEYSGLDVLKFATASKDVVWNGDSASAGVPGDGTSWGDANNWTRDGVPDTAFAAEDNTFFAAGSSQSVIDLQIDHTVAALSFQSSYELRNQKLTVLSGNVTVEAAATATIASELLAETINHSIRKLGPGLLQVDGHAGQTVVKEGTLGGTGSLDHLTVRSGATVAPGGSPGILTVDETLTILSGATLEIEIGGTAPGIEYDQLSVAGTAALAGILNVALIDDGNGLFAPSIGDSFTILTAAGGITGMFEMTSLPTLGNNLQWNVNPTESSVLLEIVAAGLRGDFNGNDVVDAADYTVWRDMLGQTGPNLAADGTGPAGVPDGVVDGLDYEFWKSHFGEVVNGGSAALQGSATPHFNSVPEPSTTTLVILSIAAASLAVVVPPRTRRKGLYESSASDTTG